MRFYFGTIGWGWRMYGIGWGAKWFLGFSVALLRMDRKCPIDNPDDTIAHAVIRRGPVNAPEMRRTKSPSP